MPIVLALTVLIQACFIFHVFKTGRPYWWAFVILGFPVLGCVMYYLVEGFPDLQEHRAVRKVAQVMAPDAEFLRRVEEVEICGSVESKAALADQGAGEVASARQAYERLLPGFVGREARYRYAMLLQATGHAEAARAELETILTHAKRFRIRHEEEQEWVAAARRGIGTG